MPVVTAATAMPVLLSSRAGRRSVDPTTVHRRQAKLSQLDSPPSVEFFPQSGLELAGLCVEEVTDAVVNKPHLATPASAKLPPRRRGASEHLNNKLGEVLVAAGAQPQSKAKLLDVLRRERNGGSWGGGSTKTAATSSSTVTTTPPNSWACADVIRTSHPPRRVGFHPRDSLQGVNAAVAAGCCCCCCCWLVADARLLFLLERSLSFCEEIFPSPTVIVIRVFVVFWRNRGAAKRPESV
jgi:hypothetical protein